MDGYILCRTEGVWHQVIRPNVVKEKVDLFVGGTHGGIVGERPRQRLSDEARDLRRIKNARNAGRRGKATRPRGTQRRGR